MYFQGKILPILFSFVIFSFSLKGHDSPIFEETNGLVESGCRFLFQATKTRSHKA